MRTLAGTMQRIDCRRRASERTWGAIDRDGVRRLAEEGAQLVDALPAADYAEGRLPGAISLPLKELNAETARRLDRVVYRHHHL